VLSIGVAGRISSADAASAAEQAQLRELLSDLCAGLRWPALGWFWGVCYSLISQLSSFLTPSRAPAG
jgi:hypothetical protein